MSMNDTSTGGAQSSPPAVSAPPSSPSARSSSLIGFSWASSAARSDTSWWRAGPSPRLLLWVAIAAYAVGFAALSVLRDRALNTGRFDLGNMVQAVWATAHGHPLRVTDL